MSEINLNDAFDVLSDKCPRYFRDIPLEWNASYEAPEEWILNSEIVNDFALSADIMLDSLPEDPMTKLDLLQLFTKIAYKLNYHANLEGYLEPILQKTGDLEITAKIINFDERRK